MSTPFQLSELVAQIRAQLLMIRQNEDAQRDPLMVLRRLDLELQVEIDANVNAGLKFVIGGFGSKVASKRTNTLKLSFEPYGGSPPDRASSRKTQVELTNCDAYEHIILDAIQREPGKAPVERPERPILLTPPVDLGGESMDLR